MVSPFSFVKSSAQSQITILEKYLQYTQDYGMKTAIKFGGIVGKNWSKTLQSVPKMAIFTGWTTTCPACLIGNPGNYG
jgi:hypothetical protein